MAPLDLPRWTGSPDDARSNLLAVERWATSAAMATLVAEFGGITDGMATGALLDYLDDFSAAHWDFRRGQERNQAERVEFTPERDTVILDCAAELGLTQVPPRHEHYDTVVMTGGMVRAGIAKPRYVRMLLDDGLRVDNIVFLGGFRPFAGDEQEVATGLGLEGDNEFDAMVAGLHRAFGPLGEPHVEEAIAHTQNGSWRELSWEASALRVSAVAAPSSLPALRRANTVDTYRFWAEFRRRPSEQSLLVVTAPVYVPYQGAGAVQVLGIEYGLAVETVGISRRTGHLGRFSQEY
ncbi:MAG TPA: hypothetical protein VFT01_07155, partial [Homoserinimonas sp.]|nr:hypothetical protein [Homoserinimonas sp.]